MTSCTIVIVSYNTRELTLSCLIQIQNVLGDDEWRIVVVDNASTDGTADAVRAAFPLVTVMRSEHNRGFGAGNNLALRTVTSETVILLNSDVITDPTTLRNLVARLIADDDIGALSPLLVTQGGQGQAFAFGSDPTLGYLVRRGLRALLRRGPPHDWNATAARDVDWASAACIAIRYGALKKVGLFDENIFLYFEDNDLCLRIRHAGWRIVYDPVLQVTHLGGASMPNRGSANQRYYESLVYFYRKHYGTTAASLLGLLLAPYQALMRASKV